MKDFIFIAGAPGTGKSTVSKKLQKSLDCPIFEFGWIPEFRNKGNGQIPYSEEEYFSFENLVLVLKNYAKHGFKNVIVTDLNNKFIEKLPDNFKDYDYFIYTLRISDENTLKERVLSEDRKDQFRDWEKALEINQGILDRKAFENETFIDIGTHTADQVFEELSKKLNV